MKTKFFSFLLAIVASVGTINSSTQIDGIWYNLDSNTKTAKVTYKGNGTSSEKYSGSLTIPATVTYDGTKYSVTGIGDYAFCSCGDLTSVSMPNTISSIGTEAFRECGIKTIEIPTGINALGVNLFAYSALTEVTIPSNIQSIEGGAFNNCRSLSSLTLSEGIQTIGNSAFSGCYKLTSVDIPNSVTSIGITAFSNCINLTSVTIGEGVKYMGISTYDKGVFDDCENLTTIVWNAVNGACYDYDSYSGKWEYFCPFIEECTQITSFTIGEKVKEIPESLCSGMINLTSINIPNSVQVIGANAFRGCAGLNSVSIGENVYSIGREAFYGCKNLTSLTIPGSVYSLGYSAFASCSNLASVTIGCDNFVSGLSIDGYPGSSEVKYDHLFSGCSSLNTVVWNVYKLKSPDWNHGGLFYSVASHITSFTFGDNVHSIPDYLCYNMKYVQSIVIPEYASTIGKQAFYNCSSLTTLNTNNVTFINDGAFSFCSALKSVEIPIHNADFGIGVFSGCFALEDISVPASALTLAENDIANAPGHLQSITVNGGLITETGFAFITHSYRTLETLDVAATYNTTLSDEAFKGCYKLQTLKLPNYLTKISYMAVAECVKLQAINIPSSVTEIDDRAFENCRSLKSVTFGDNASAAPSSGFGMPAASSQLRRIGNWAFYNAHELQNLVIPEGVEEIGDAAFYGCTYLTELTLPASILSIGDNCFALCSKIQKITVNSPEPPQIFAKTFFDVNRQIPVYVPDGSYDAYKADTYWGELNIVDDSHPNENTENLESQAMNFVKSTKILRDGQILILRGDKTYTLQGQEVK